MSVLPTRRSSLCLFCAFNTAARPRPQHHLRLSYVQVARRTGGGAGKGSRKSKAHPVISFHGGKFNSLTYIDAKPTSPVHVTVDCQLQLLRNELSEPDFLEILSLTRKAFEEEWSVFEESIDVLLRKADNVSSWFIQSTSKGGNEKIRTRLRYLFYAQACGGRFTKAELDNQKEVADLRYPTEWYPATREIPRTVHLHVGPTNSGKTYQALKSLEEAKSGIYMGPLRLLAHEVYTRLNSKGKPCALITGEEQRVPEGNHNMWSCTIEMAPLNVRMDVAVIDEIQMINHESRGWAWTQAFLGIQAKELHLCGEARTVPLIRELCALVGDKVHVHEYERLTPLKVADRSLGGKLTGLEKGDCVVAFSVLAIHGIRKTIEKNTGKKCAIVYGSLPPETRAHQARLFNDPDNDYDFLVASDAIGMGLNLSIKRVIFESIVKNNGASLVPLQVSEVKQIAGRAGRYKTAHQAIAQDEADRLALQSIADPVVGLDDRPKAQTKNATIGYATTLYPEEFRNFKRSMEREADVIKTAGLFPPALIIERFSSYFPPGTPFSYILLRLHEISIIHPRFHLCALKEQLAIADCIHTVRNLSIQERIMLCAAPSNMRAQGEKRCLREMAECIAENKSGELLDLKSLPLEILDQKPSGDRTYLWQLEQLHKMLVLYSWLSFRFPNVFTSRKLCSHVLRLSEEAIERTLDNFSFTQEQQTERLKKKKEVLRDLESSEEDYGKETANDDEVAKENIPQAVCDMLTHMGSFSADAVTRSDDQLEYPTPEVEELDEENTEQEGSTEGNGSFGPNQSSASTNASLSEDDTMKRDTPLHIDPKPDQEQSRI
ncbi:P-loop containing nucleoside triphosphate hydrolase protein [Pleomassaria siparia CBS 279.74]|uniref:RNA helicase n=1 Tax=Pleomassaria siparia CBS 279.74 TaxID=1314801 RepID=A0A6G1K8G5_9PLEO|nr:P-loop containing nucleoside triphosphate hydrolase protein [Pleomassaria siparia CBS 279.74]